MEVSKKSKMRTIIKGCFGITTVSYYRICLSEIIIAYHVSNQGKWKRNLEGLFFLIYGNLMYLIH